MYDVAVGWVEVDIKSKESSWHVPVYTNWSALVRRCCQYRTLRDRSHEQSGGVGEGITCLPRSPIAFVLSSEH